MNECICGRYKGPIRLNKVSDTLTIHECYNCGGEIARWEEEYKRPICGSVRKLSREEKQELR